jgi:homoserine O-acetyltransferase
MSNLQSHTFNHPFVTECRFSIPEPTVAYQTWGTLNEARDNAALVCHALTGNTKADEWFGGFFGQGKTLDPSRQFIICANVLGSCYGTTGPVSINPETNNPYRIDFPIVTVRDTVRLQQQLLNEMDIKGIEMVIGGSLGGMQALEFCIMDDRARAAVCIGMGKAHSPWQIGISHTQRQAIYNDANWKDGYYSDEKMPLDGLATARMIAMISYRSPKDFDSKFGRNGRADRDLFEVESYLNYQGKKLADRFDAVSYVRLTQMMDSHDVARGRRSYQEVLAKVHIPVLAIGIDSDLLYPIHEQKELAKLLPNGMYAEISSPHGHDGFLIEFEKMNAAVSSFLAELKTL